MRSRWTSIVVIGLLLGVVVVAAAQPPEAVSLRLRSTAGERLIYQANFSLKGTVVFPNPGKLGTTITVPPEVQAAYTMEQMTKAVDADGNMDIAQKVDAFDVRFTVGNLSGRLALAGEEAGPDRLIKMPDLPLAVTLSPQGMPIAIKGLAAFMPAMGPTPPMPPPEEGDEDEPEDGEEAAPSAEEMSKQMEAMVNAMLRQVAMPQFPDHPVAPGAIWNDNREVRVPMVPFAIPIKQISRFIGYENIGPTKTAHVETRVEVTLKVGPGEIMPGQPPVPVGIEERVTATNQIYLDPAAGRIVKQTSEGDLTLRVTMGAGDGLAAGEVGKADLHVVSDMTLTAVR